MACFRCNATENLIFLLKYSQQKVDLNTSKKSLVFVTIRHLYVQLSYTKISYLRKNTHLRKDAAFLHFRLKESSENMIFPWNWNIRKQAKIWSFLHFSQIFIKRKFFFSCSANSMFKKKWRYRASHNFKYGAATRKWLWLRNFCNSFSNRYHVQP